MAPRTTGGVRRSAGGLAYRRVGEGPPVVLLHGIPGSGAAWSEVAADLRTDHDVVVVDLLGFGDSERPTGIDELHVRAQSAAVAELLDELRLDGASVVGHDFGGPTAVMVSARSERLGALGLLAGNVHADTPVPFPLSTVTWPVVGALSSRLLFGRPALGALHRFGRGRGAPPSDAGPALGDREQSAAIATIFRESLVRLGELYRPVQEQLAAVEVPRLVAWGDRDRLLDVEQGRRVAATWGVDLQVIEGAGHFLPEERPAEVAALVRSLSAGRSSAG